MCWEKNQNDRRQRLEGKKTSALGKETGQKYEKLLSENWISNEIKKAEVKKAKKKNTSKKVNNTKVENQKQKKMFVFIPPGEYSGLKETCKRN